MHLSVCVSVYSFWCIWIIQTLPHTHSYSYCHCTLPLTAAPPLFLFLSLNGAMVPTVVHLWYYMAYRSSVSRSSEGCLIFCTSVNKVWVSSCYFSAQHRWRILFNLGDRIIKLVIFLAGTWGWQIWHPSSQTAWGCVESGTFFSGACCDLFLCGFHTKAILKTKWRLLGKNTNGMKLVGWFRAARVAFNDHSEELWSNQSGFKGESLVWFWWRALKV